MLDRNAVELAEFGHKLLHPIWLVSPSRPLLPTNKQLVVRLIWRPPAVIQPIRLSSARRPHKNPFTELPQGTILGEFLQIKKV